MKKTLRNAFQTIFPRKVILELRAENAKLKDALNATTKSLCKAGEEVQELKLSKALDSFERALNCNCNRITKDDAKEALEYAATYEKFDELSDKFCKIIEKSKKNSLLKELEKKPHAKSNFDARYEPDRHLLHIWAQEIMQTNKCSYEEALKIAEEGRS